MYVCLCIYQDSVSFLIFHFKTQDKMDIFYVYQMKRLDNDSMSLIQMWEVEAYSLICCFYILTSYRVFCFGLVSLFSWHIKLLGLFNAKVILLEEQQWYYLTQCWEEKRVHTFPKDICLKVNIIAHWCLNLLILKLQPSTSVIASWDSSRKYFKKIQL